MRIQQKAAMPKRGKGLREKLGTLNTRVPVRHGKYQEVAGKGRRRIEELAALVDGGMRELPAILKIGRFARGKRTKVKIT